MYALRKLVFHFLEDLIGNGRGDRFPFDFEQNGNSFGSENRKENCHHDQFPFNLKGNGNTSFLSVDLKNIPSPVDSTAITITATSDSIFEGFCVVLRCRFSFLN